MFRPRERILNEKRDDVPAGLKSVIDRMLAKDPAERFATPIELAVALEPYASMTRTSDRPTVTIAPPVPTLVIPAPPPSLPHPHRNRPWGLFAGIAGMLLIAGVLFALLRGPRDVDDRHAAPTFSGPPITVGILHSRTGTMAISEKPVIDATIFAIEAINEAGGLLGRKIEPIIEDGASDWPTFAKKAEKLITQDKVSVVFGCWTSASRKTVKPMFEKHNHLLFYPVQYEGLEQSPNIVYTGAAPNQQIIPALKWFIGSTRKKRIFLVGSDYLFPHAANAIIRDQAAELGGEIVGEEYLPLGSADTAAIIKKIQAANPEVILNTINGDSNIAFFRALRSAGITSEKVPTVSFSISDEELSSLNIRDVKGDYAAWNYFQSIESTKNDAFVKSFQSRFGHERILSDPMEAAYNGVHLWAGAVRSANSDEPIAVRRAIKSQSFDAPEGEVRIDPETQHTSKFIRIGRVSDNGRFEVVYCSDVPITPTPYPTTRSRGEWNTFLTDLNLKWGGRWENSSP